MTYIYIKKGSIRDNDELYNGVHGELFDIDKTEYNIRLATGGIVYYIPKQNDVYELFKDFEDFVEQYPELFI